MNADGLGLYGQFVGSWDVESSIAGRGEWHFAWILGGLAVQDVIYREGDPPEKHGTTVRAYDERAGIWHVFYTCPGDHEFVSMVGRAVDGGILQEGHDLDEPSSLQRWSFSEIAPSSFRWRGERSTDGGATWTLTNEMRATRRT